MSTNTTPAEPSWDDEARNWHLGTHSWEPVLDMEGNSLAVDCPNFNASAHEPDAGCCGEDICACAIERRKRGGRT